MPELEFRFDESIVHQDRIEQILRDLHANDPRPEEGASDAAADAASRQQAADPITDAVPPTPRRTTNDDRD